MNAQRFPYSINESRLNNAAAKIQMSTQLITNNRHSANSANWITPSWITNLAREVMDGVIHLDPASCAEANQFVKAQTYFDRKINGLETPWSHADDTLTNVWINPPGGWEHVAVPQVTKRNGLTMISNVEGETVKLSRVKLWWQRLLAQYVQTYFAQASWLSFSIDAMQTTQVECETSVLAFPTCVFRNRINFIDPATGAAVSGNTHASALHYIPGRVDRTEKFVKLFAPHGEIIRAIA